MGSTTKDEGRRTQLSPFVFCYAAKPKLAGASPPEHRRRLPAWLARHPLLVFFALTYTISWTIWLSEPFLERVDPVGGNWYGMLAPFGPTIAAIVVSALLRGERLRPAPLLPGLGATLLVLAAATWAGWEQLKAVSSSRHPVLAAVFWTIITLVPTTIVALTGSRVRGVRELLTPLLRWRTHYNNYLLALLLLPVAALSGIILLRLLGDPWPPFPRSGPPLPLARDLIFVFVSTLIFGGGLGEEPGWRGFALPHLQQRVDPLTASVILSLAWSVWFLPLHLLAVSNGTQPFGEAFVVGLALRLFSVFPATLMYTWLYNRTGGNLLLLVMMHASVNNTIGWWLPATAGLYIGIATLVPVLIINGRMWRQVGRG